MSGEVALNGWIAIPPAEQGRILPLLAEHLRLTRAEPGCLAFAVTPSPRIPAASSWPSASATARPSRRIRPAPPHRPGAQPPGTSSATTGSRRDHGRPHRCAWAGADPLMQAYHDEEWGVPERDGRALWEKLVLDGFQAGLAWITVLRKRDAFREAFAGFDPAVVARFDEADDPAAARQSGDHPLARQDRGHDRRRAHLLRDGRARRGFQRLLLGLHRRQGRCSATASACRPGPRSPKRSRRISSAAASSTSAPTIVYAWMQAVGIVNDHAATCSAATRCDAVSARSPRVNRL